LNKLKRRASELNKIVATQRDKVHVLQGHVEEAELVKNKMPAETTSRKVMDERLTALRAELDRELNLLYLNDGAQQESTRMYQILELKSRGGSVEA
jgi:hypothetical protein